MREVVIVDAVRTPIGRYSGALKDVRPDDLAALVITTLLERTGIEPGAIEDVIFGCTNQAGEDNRNVARMALLLAGLPVEVGGQTVNRLCGSGMQAVLSAAQAIRDGCAPLVLGGDLNLGSGDSSDLKTCLPAGSALVDDGGVQHIVATPEFIVGSSQTIDLGGTTDHPGLLVTLAPRPARGP